MTENKNTLIYTIQDGPPSVCTDNRGTHFYSFDGPDDDDEGAAGTPHQPRRTPPGLSGSAAIDRSE
jgi:hypothetical protein